MTGYRPDTRKSERSKLEHYCIFFYALLLCIICAHITIHKFISWLLANINHHRSLFCCFQRFDLKETQDADWTCMTVVYLKFLDGLLCILSTPHCRELMELMMGNHSCGGSHGRACNMLFMMKIDDGLTLCWWHSQKLWPPLILTEWVTFKISLPSHRQVTEHFYGDSW